MSFFELKNRNTVKEQTDYLLFDASNIIYRTFSALNATSTDSSEDVTTGFMHHTLLTVMHKYYKLYNPNKIILVFDRPNWRKDYTTDSEMCVSGKIYKGHRRLNFTAEQLRQFQLMLEHIKTFEETLRSVTTIKCLSANKLEADDLIAGFVQKFPDNHTVIISGDKDLIQLLVNENIKLIDPATGKAREHTPAEAKFFMFEKCFRGDSGDNVSSAYPKLRSTKIQQSYTDPFLFTNLMNTEWTNHEGKKMLVETLYEENRLLMDLTKQPECVKRIMYETIDAELERNSSFTLFHFLKYCGKYKLERVKERIETYAEMLSR